MFVVYLNATIVIQRESLVVYLDVFLPSSIHLQARDSTEATVHQLFGVIKDKSWYYIAKISL